MFVTAVQLPKFGIDDSKRIIQGLNQLNEVTGESFVPGFIQSLLLRGRQDDALLLTFWRSRVDLENFLESEAGKRIAKLQKELFSGGEAAFNEYYTTWQAVSHSQPFYSELLK